jgi:hypothetical protein
MPYFRLRDGKTVVEALGQATVNSKETYYASFAGPAQAAKAIWAAAIGSAKTSEIRSNWEYASKMPKPVAKAVVVKLPNSNYVHYVMRSADPTFILVTSPKMAKLKELQGHPITSVGSDEQTKVYREIKALLPGWDIPAYEGRSIHISKVTDWLEKQTEIQNELARKLVNALNQATKVPVLPEWGPALLDDLPASAHEYVACYGDAVTALKLNPDYDWADWIGRMLRRGQLTIPQLEGE